MDPGFGQVVRPWLLSRDWLWAPSFATVRNCKTCAWKARLASLSLSLSLWLWLWLPLLLLLLLLMMMMLLLLFLFCLNPKLKKNKLEEWKTNLSGHLFVCRFMLKVVPSCARQMPYRACWRAWEAISWSWGDGFGVEKLGCLYVYIYMYRVCIVALRNIAVADVSKIMSQKEGMAAWALMASRTDTLTIWLVDWRVDWHTLRSIDGLSNWLRWLPQVWQLQAQKWSFCLRTSFKHDRCFASIAPDTKKFHGGTKSCATRVRNPCTCHAKRSSNLE